MSKFSKGHRKHLKPLGSQRRINSVLDQLQDQIPSAEIKAVKVPLPNSFEVGKSLVKPESMPQSQIQAKPQTTLTAVIFTPMTNGLGVLVSRDRFSCIFFQHSIDMDAARNHEYAAKQLCTHIEEMLKIKIAEMLFITHFSRSGNVKVTNDNSFLGSADLRQQNLPRKYAKLGQVEREAIVIEVRDAVNQLTSKYLKAFKLALGCMGERQPQLLVAMQHVQKLVQARLDTLK